MISGPIVVRSQESIDNLTKMSQKLITQDDNSGSE